ncbi:MAG: hypothetical protein L0Z50_05020 [Verrucomicrobiales bacterium]|nr:hypothetical protein [Verrucomicrobiales bacterium]
MDFAANIAVTSRVFNNAAIWPLQALTDGRVLAEVLSIYTNEPARRLIRLSPTGALDLVFALQGYGQAAAQGDGKVLVNLETADKVLLSRLNDDGSPDLGFPPIPNHWFVLTHDGKILTVLSNSLSRFNGDGSRDETFVSRVFTNGIGPLSPQASGKLFILNEGTFIALGNDGAIDADLRLEPAPSSLRSWTLLEGIDGGLFTTAIDYVDAATGGFGTVTRSSSDGRLQSVLARFKQSASDGPCNGYVFPPSISLQTGNGFFIAGRFDTVEGFPRSGLARLFINPPERDFRVITPARSRKNAIAKINVVRTGPTTNRASVVFRTKDDSAKAGQDYEFRAGTLNFEPLEVCKELLIPLFSPGWPGCKYA